MQAEARARAKAAEAAEAAAEVAVAEAARVDDSYLLPEPAWHEPQMSRPDR